MTDLTGKSPQGDDNAHSLGCAALPPGTQILSLAGALPIEALYPGDRVITRDAGAQVLLRITRHSVPGNMRFLAVRKDALGGKPTRDLLLPADQRILLRDWRAKALYGTSAARVPLSRLIDGDFVRWSDRRPDALITMHFKREHVLYADGLEVMSALPDTVRA